MTLNPANIDSRSKQVLAGLFLSKFDEAGLSALGFETFTEAFNALGYGLGGRPASIKNYRDEFDPLFPNKRQGWRNRKRRDYCIRIEQDYRDLGFDDFAQLIGSLVNTANLEATIDASEDTAQTDASSFAKRLITGKAAEQYFINRFDTLPEFTGYELEDTTSIGCGYDFRLWPSQGTDFKAVEVKGMAERSGGLLLTNKEYNSAAKLTNRFFLVVVRNFRETPFHTVHANPLAGSLSFIRRERVIVDVSWTSTV
ncbi:MAG: DUF3883 domain-containing protein [Verrucomicrobia bacterium]|nr:DUF3883 domain-containing protein [Verrucomicrobiota bacterium]